MPTTYSCDKCGKDFNQKGDYIKHINKKYPCISIEELKKTGIKSEDIQLSRLEQLFNKLRDIMRNNENIVGKDALDVISDFLLLRLLKPLLKKNSNNPNAPYIDMLEIDYTMDDDAQKYKEYIYWDKLVEKVKKIQNTSDNKEKDELDYIVRNALFKGILRIHPTTSMIFKEKSFVIKKTSTIISIINEINKFDENGSFDNIDVDVKGKAYELTIQKEASTNKEFGQFFTPRWVVKYMVKQLNPNINKDGTYDKIMDPACGTAGFLTEYFKFIKTRADKEDVLMDQNVQHYVYGYEIVSKTIELALINLLLNTGVYNYNVKHQDFLENSISFIKNKFKGHILANPPFSIDKNYENLCTSNEYKILLPTKTKSGTFLFLQACMNILDDGYKCCLVSPNGRELFGKNKEFIEIRRNLMECCNLYKIVYLPSQSFKPYTGVETLILFFEKGSKTKNIAFYKIEKNKDESYNEKLIQTIEIDEIIKKKYSWNIKDYNDYSLLLIEGTIQYELGTIINIFCRSNRRSKEGKEKGLYPFYYCSILGHLYLDEYDITDENIIMNTTNGLGKCKLYYCNGNFSIAENTIRFKSIDETKIKTKLIYYYLILNIDKIEKCFRGTNQKQLYRDDFNKIKLNIPPLQIQQQIVTELDAIYNTIEACNKIIDNMKAIKQAKFNNLMSNANYNIQKLSEITTINIGGTPSRKIVKYFEGNNKWAQISDMNQKYIDDTKEKISNDGIVNSSVKLIKKGSILLSFKLSIGKVSIANDNMYCNEAIAFFNGNANVSNKYLYSYFENTDISYNRSGCIGSGSLNKEKLNELDIKIPSLEDQQKIIKEMEELDNFEEQINKQIKSLEMQAKETLERHLKLCKNDSETDMISEQMDDIIETENKGDEDEIIKAPPRKKVNTSKMENDNNEDETIKIPPRKKVKKVVKKVAVKKVANK